MRDDGVHEADAERLFGAEGVARVAELARAADPDAAGEALRAAEAGDDAEVHLGLAELRLVARVDEVAREGELAPSAEREAVHGGEDREGAPTRSRSPRACPRSANVRASAAVISLIAAMSAPAANALSPAPVRIAQRTLAVGGELARPRRRARGGASR